MSAWVDAPLRDLVRERAREAGVPVSDWIAEACRLRAEYADAARTIYPAAHEREVDRRASPALHEVRS